jgi:hypothetical protein
MTRYIPLWLADGEYAADADRRLIQALWPDARTLGLACSAQGGGFVVNVAAGAAAVPAANGLGTVLCASDAVEQVPLNASDPTQHRFDIIAVWPRAADIGATPDATDFVFNVIQGVTAAAPVPPPVPPGQVAISQWYVGGGTSTLTNANLTDLRHGHLQVPDTSDIEEHAHLLPRGLLGRALVPNFVGWPTGTTVMTQFPITLTETRNVRVDYSFMGTKRNVLESSGNLVLTTDFAPEFAGSSERIYDRVGFTDGNVTVPFPANGQRLPLNGAHYFTVPAGTRNVRLICSITGAIDMIGVTEYVNYIAATDLGSPLLVPFTVKPPPPAEPPPGWDLSN